MNGKARLAFVGLGTMGRDLLKESLRNPQVDVVGLCDGDVSAVDEAVALCGDSAPAAYDDFDALLKGAEPDGVVVATPQQHHAALTIAALEAGCHVFCEKPMAMDVRECDAMIAAAERTGKGLMIGQVLRYIDVYRYVLERAQSGEFGRALAVRIIRSGGRWGGWSRPWRTQKATCGGLLYEINVHEIDFMCEILGQPTTVTALGKRFVNDEVDYEDFVTAQIAFADGGLGSLTASSCDHIGRYTGEVFLEKGTIYYDSVTSTCDVRKEDEVKEKLRYEDIGRDWESGVYREMREFVEACLGEHRITIPGEDGRRAVEVAQAGCLSIDESRTVTLPLPRD